ncbi:hypothetical protein C8A00DRAFT_13962 [Chaetomidium leptoderma]|uniref:Fatty acid hydroxylase domain-containing protein n=1 Tax=Chaetomidium leptoderma TaxID=669021 RepID=A0AAN6VPL1_9PEZI|nr:hypothetical protein C8A00DRAFT_13962 [Chaetomidium leptoderma]
MDVLLSLPVVSYLFTTSLTSWSTSLNLLFFYMTWSTLILSHSPLKIEIVGTTVLRIALWLVPSLIFLAFDTLLPSLAENIKYNGASALPRRDARALAKLAGLAIFNLALETGVEAALSLGVATLLKTPAFHTSTTLPLPWQMIKHLALLFAAREVLTYYIHRYLLHGHPTSRRRLSALHTRYAHAHRRPPSALLLKTDHPLPYLLHRFLPLYLPALALHSGNLHILTFLLFVALATLEETLSMSGYTVVPGIVLGGMARRTAVHYVSASSSFSSVAGKKKAGGGGNFGSWGVLDWMHGTSLGGDVMADLRDEAEKHRLQERGASKVGEVGGAVRDGVEGLRKRKAGSRGRKARGGG